MTSPTRLRVVTPERLDALVSNLVNTGGTATATAVATKAGTSTGGSVTGVTTATASTVMGRDASGRSQIANPSVSADIANMGWVNTQLTGYVATSTKGAASGVASLDGSSFLTAAQVPQYLHQHRGTGTAFPTSSIRAGDTFLHSGVGCLFRYDGTNWRQAGAFEVANTTARTAISTTYSAVLHKSFRVWQTDIGTEWTWDGSAWMWSAGEPEIFTPSYVGGYQDYTPVAPLRIYRWGRRYLARGAVTYPTTAFAAVNAEYSVANLPSGVTAPSANANTAGSIWAANQGYLGALWSVRSTGAITYIPFAYANLNGPSMVGWANVEWSV